MTNIKNAEPGTTFHIVTGTLHTMMGQGTIPFHITMDKITYIIGHVNTTSSVTYTRLSEGEQLKLPYISE